MFINDSKTWKAESVSYEDKFEQWQKVVNNAIEFTDFAHADLKGVSDTLSFLFIVNLLIL